MSPEFVATAILRASLLLAMGLAALRWLPAGKPQWRRTAALFCLAASLVAPFLPVLSTGVIFTPEWHARSGIATSDGNGILIAQILAVLWIAGATLAAARLILRGTRMHRWIKRCAPLSVDVFPVGGIDEIPVRVCEEAKAPCVAGFLRPVLIVPERARDWDETTWRCVVAHELQHVRQGDLWLGWIVHIARVFYWWHPLAWSLTRRMGLECEACCDEAVLRLGVKAADYARVLLGFTTGNDSRYSPGLSIQGRSPSSLRLRVERLLASRIVGPSLRQVILMVVLSLVGMAGCFWLGFTKLPNNDAVLKGETELRWKANPFPGDSE